MKLLRGLGLCLALCALALSVAPSYAGDGGMSAVGHTGHDDHGGHGQGGGHEDDDDGDDDQEGQGRVVFVAFLTGGAEVTNEGVPNQGDPDGSGVARLRFVPARGRVCIDAHVQNLDPLVLAHIHNGPAGANGPVVVDFTGLIDGSAVKGCVSADPALIGAIIASPASYYVNIHSTAFRPGAVRGQLEPRGSLRSTFRIALSGANEVGNPGDPDGASTARVAVAADHLEICVNIRARKVAPLTLAHIHNAPAGVNGPVVVDWTHLIQGTSVRGCVPVEPNLLQAIRSSPANYYVNVHTAEFPTGALRGQLE